MKQEVVHILDVLEKPLRFMQAQGFQNPDVVKNIAQHVQTQCTKIFPHVEDEDRKTLLKDLHSIFDHYDHESVFEKKDLLKKAVAKIEAFKQEPSVNFAYQESDHPYHDPDTLKDAYMVLTSRVQYAKGVGPVLADVLNKNRISTIYDLLHVTPYRYEDRTKIKKIQELHDGQKESFVGTVTYAGPTFYKGSKRRFFEVMLEDETGEIRLKWFHFHLPSFQKKFKKDQKLIVSGKVKIYKNTKEVHHPDVEIFSGGTEALSFGKVVPVYSEMGGIYQKTIRKIMHFLVLQYCEKRLELIPPALAKKYHFLPPWRVLLQLHQPKKILTEQEIDRLKRHLSFEELFFYALAYGLRKKKNAKDGIAFVNDSSKVAVLKSTLPFELTQAQEKVLDEIFQDMKSARSMNRLLQGDVGSGKTIVAFMAALHAIDNGHQVALMAPTELLANQHFENMQTWAKAVGIRVGTIVGKMTKSEKAHVAKLLQLGEIDMVVGTHALIEDYVKYQSLGLVIIDEQHRFGVAQRAKLWQKSDCPPHVLVMTATPIPRTLAMTLYGDLDVSVIDEMPPGRKPIKTMAFTDAEREKVFGFMRRQIEDGRQIYVVYPLIKESESLDYKDLEDGLESIARAFPAPEYCISVVHGRMTTKDKEISMNLFRRGQAH
ncbi:MAG: ATP-dependent DNA helicase RecG, partial [Deltaproteobacteria bacterium]|nr:ATP-dependent DNA helicase RecG [Deltaproteobacteria bacterium]